MRTIRKAPRGVSLIELMIAVTLLSIAMLGFVGAMNSAATASSVAHRRTVGTLTRSALLDRFAVTRRKVVRAITPDVWIREGCFDVNSRPLSTNTTFASTFTCDPKLAYYQTWVRVSAPVNASQFLQVYVERIDRGCTPELRDASVGCVFADMLLTD